MYITQIYQCFEGTGGCLRIKGCSHDKITQGRPGLAWFLSAVEHSWIRSGLKPLNTQCPFDYASSCHSRASSGHYKIQYLHRGFIACKRGTILFPHLRCHHEDSLFLIQWFGYGQKKNILMLTSHNSEVYIAFHIDVGVKLGERKKIKENPNSWGN